MLFRSSGGHRRDRPSARGRGGAGPSTALLGGADSLWGPHTPSCTDGEAEPQRRDPTHPCRPPDPRAPSGRMMAGPAHRQAGQWDSPARRVGLRSPPAPGPRTARGLLPTPPSGVRPEPTFQKQRRPEMRSWLAHQALDGGKGPRSSGGGVYTPGAQRPGPLGGDGKATPSRGRVCAEQTGHRLRAQSQADAAGTRL